MTAVAGTTGDRLPLRGVRVVDTTDETAWTGGRLLADLGAEVILVDPPDRLADALYVTRNVNKRSAVLRDDEVRVLLDHADIWLDAGTTGLDVSSVQAELPTLVAVIVSPFGRSGSHRGRATEGVLYALSGLLSRSRKDRRPPRLSPGRLSAEAAGAMAAYLALGAFWHRLATGEGDCIDLSSLENLIQCSDCMLATAAANLSIAKPRTLSNHLDYATRDGYVKPMTTTARHWHAMKQWLGNPPELSDPTWDEPTPRALAVDTIKPYVARLMAPMTAEEASVEGQRRGIPIAPMWSMAQLLASEGMRARGTFVRCRLAVRDGVQPSGMYLIDGRRVGPRRETVVPGEATAEIRAALDHGVPPFESPPHRLLPPVPAAGPRPLSGLRVVLLGTLMAGPEIAKLLGDLGAEVIKVESRTYPDTGRTFGGEAMMSAQFASMNRHSLSFGVDVKRPEGRDVVVQLLSGSHVLVDNLGPGALDGVGLTAEALRQANPTLVHVSTQLFGDDGPWGHWRGLGNHGRGMGAMTWLWRYPGTEISADNNIFFPDQYNGRVAAAAVVAALLDGGGRRILVSQADAVINSIAELVLAESVTPGSVQPGRHTDPDCAPWAVFPCAGEDEWCVITVQSDEQWERLARVVSEPWTEDDRWATASGRVADAVELEDLVASWTRARSPQEVVQLVRGADVPVAWCTPTLALLDDRQLQEREFLRLSVQPGFAPIFIEGDSWSARHLPRSEVCPAPALGQHTRQLATSLLGLTDDDVDRLLDSGVFELNHQPED